MIGDVGAVTTFNQPGDQTGTSLNPLDPILGPLQDNGGLTPTHALLSGSPAIDAGDPAFVPPPDFDQRGTGFARIVDGDNDDTATIDIGAFEKAALPPTSAPVTVGRVLRTDGFGIGSAAVTAVDQEGNVLRTRTNGFGYFIFDSVPSGRSYVISVNHKQFTFAPQVVNVDDNILDLTFQQSP